jgi:hypothetical protein
MENFAAARFILGKEDEEKSKRIRIRKRIGGVFRRVLFVTKLYRLREAKAHLSNFRDRLALEHSILGS